MDKEEIGWILEIIGLVLILVAFYAGLIWGWWWIAIPGFIIWISGILIKHYVKRGKAE